jgi:hypothetical protein
MVIDPIPIGVPFIETLMPPPMAIDPKAGGPPLVISKALSTLADFWTMMPSRSAWLSRLVRSPALEEAWDYPEMPNKIKILAEVFIN